MWARFQSMVQCTGAKLYLSNSHRVTRGPGHVACKLCQTLRKLIAGYTHAYAFIWEGEGRRHRVCPIPFSMSLKTHFFTLAPIKASETVNTHSKPCSIAIFHYFMQPFRFHVYSYVAFIPFGIHNCSFQNSTMFLFIRFKSCWLKLSLVSFLPFCFVFPFLSYFVVLFSALLAFCFWICF